ncbi:uncharacterized protein [Anabrus simplex]|uniref:uncharacterized protein n=1 Tax=Anabrus simplex TaxID=316456 RepID=UPI0035A3130E
MGKEENSTEESLPTWLTEEFLQTALRASDDDSFLTIVSSRISSATGKGDNFLGAVYRAFVTTSTGEQRSLILKSIPAGTRLEIFIREADLFDTEIEMYTKTLPKMYELLEEKNLSFEPMTAKFIYSNPESDVIMLEDLTASGYKMAKRQNGLDLEHCKMVLKSLATFHAASVAVYSKDPACMESYKEGIFKEKTREFLGTYFTSSVQALLEEVKTWPDFKEQYSDKLQHLEDNWWQKIGPCLHRDEEGFNVLNHGDLWVNNMMFTYSPEDEVMNVKFIDLQNVHFSSPVIDLLYFLYTSPSDDVRQKYFDQLIETYHETLDATLIKLDCVKKAPSLDKLSEELKKRMSYVLFPAICELPNMLAKQDDVFDIGHYFTEGQKGTPKNKAYSGAEYKRVIQRLLPMFKNSGIL